MRQRPAAVLQLLAAALLGASSAAAQGVGVAAHGEPLTGPALIAELARRVPQLQAEAIVPGVAVALVEGGQVAWTGEFGVLSTRSKAKVTSETVFEAASLSKPVFAYAVLQLVERGILDLDVPLTTYTGRRYIEGDPLLDRITARHVLSNTTGFPNWRPRQAQLQVHFTPGERFSYSGEGYAYLQEAVEYTTGKPLEVLMQELVFEPLAMTSSSFIWRSIHEDRKATGHDEIGQPNIRREPPAAEAASSLHTTATDYARFVAALMRRETLTARTYDDMWSPQVTLDATCMICIGQEMRSPSASLAWGLGWGLETATADTTIWHWGDNQDMHAFVLAIPARQQALVVLTNGENGITLIPALSASLLGRPHSAYEWLRVGPTSTPVRRLQVALVRRGNAAMTDYVRRRESLPMGERITESEMTALGHELVNDGRVDLAITVFRQNSVDYPLRLHHMVHLGGAHLLVGDRGRALEAFERILALDPYHPTARGMAAELRVA
ncbi:MAG TPA: serine hydrolase, partial [Gemmatimonadales bacterium]|nr:serine hydrolase [Gemmatimonadales bacterium]